MRRIKHFQATASTLYVLTEDGFLWKQVGDDWKAVQPPGDGDPFRPDPNDERRILKRLQAGAGFPKA